jgi:predicted glycosyltransferase
MSAGSAVRRVLLYSHDTYGLGHLRRNLVIARQLLAGPHPPRVVLASGSPVIDQVMRPDGLVCVQLPPVVKTGDDEYRPIDPAVAISLVRRARSAVLLDVIARWKPDVFLIDHAPQGMKGELLPVFDAIPLISPRTKVVLGLRDILDEPERVVEAWSADHVYETLESVYDRILVYGEQDLFDLGAAYRIPEPVASRLEYCGYVTGNTPVRSAEAPGGLPNGEYVLGTVGGGGDGVEVLMATARAAAASDLGSVLCMGPLMSGQDRRQLRALASSVPGAAVVDHVRDLTGVATRARCVVSRGGYNSLCELVSMRVPTIVVPRAWPRREQLLRARTFASRGLVELIEDEGDDLVQRLAAAMSTARPPGPDARPLDFRGRERVAEVLDRVAGSASRTARDLHATPVGVSA